MNNIKNGQNPTLHGSNQCLAPLDHQQQQLLATPLDFNGDLSTKTGFSSLTHDFFSRFMQRYLTYHLSRELAVHVGPNQRFRDPSEHTQFLEQIAIHTRQAALIVRDYAGGWYSKSKYETGISKDSARRFAAYSLIKLRDELQIRGARDVG